MKDKVLFTTFPKTEQDVEVIVMDWVKQTPRFFLNLIEESNLNTREEIIKLLEHYEEYWLQEKILAEVKVHLNTANT